MTCSRSSARGRAVVQAVSTTMAFVRLLSDLIATRRSAGGSCRSSPTRRARSAWSRCSPSSRSTRRTGSCTTRSTSKLLWLRRGEGRADPRGGHHRGRRHGVVHRRRHHLRHARRADDPVLHLLLDVRVPADRRPDLGAGDARGRGFLLGATAGRTTLNGEGLQHEDGHSLLLASTNPACLAYDPAYAYELAAIVRDGIERMYAKGEDVFYYVTLYNENYPQPAMPEGSEEGSSTASTASGRAPRRDAAARAQLLGSGTMMAQVLRAQEILAGEVRRGGGRLVGDQLRRAAARGARTSSAGIASTRVRSRAFRTSRGFSLRPRDRSWPPPTT